ncbi:MAG TPA: hypothetical protein VF121_01930 [Thermoanaerobaculia bacterium]|nr:hypothetical protein [Thermoanaerobaculia bacterium]
MYSRNPGPGRLAMGGLGLGGPAPRDLLVLLAVLFVTFALQFLAPALVAPLRLGSDAWRSLWLWQLATYPAAGFGAPSLWFLLELLMVFWFGRDVYYQLGRRRFWRLLAGGALAAGAAAVAVDAARALLAGSEQSFLFPLMQGQRMVLAVLVAAFATLNRDATIYLFFVLPVAARWFLWLELLIAFIGFLQMPVPGAPRDLPGLLGIVTAVGLTWWTLSRRGARPGLRESRLRVERWFLERRLDRQRRKRRLRVVREEPGEVRKGPWVH